MDKLIIIRTDNQNNLYEQIISLITANQAKMETMSFGVFPTLFFPGLEIRQHQRRVFRDGEEINLTRLEYSTLVFLASNPGNVLTQEQIFEAVWNMDSDSCHTVQQRVKLPPPGGFLRIAVREEKLIYRNMIPGYKVIEYL